MTTVAEILVFVLGMHLSLRTVAACYRIIDLWYTIRTEYPRVIRDILRWVAVTGALIMVLPDDLQRSLLWGAGSFVVLYLSLYVMRYPLLALRR
ncbi:MAG TPA: hypothetical protein VNL18_07795 [Gemmatimonadales bacterium]|nr:hypothetical protein [Gemmatimonadales bacterium]